MKQQGRLIMANKSRAAVCNLLDQLKKTSAKTVEDASKQTNAILQSDIPYALQYLEPAQCTKWSMANRQFITDELCQELIDSIEKVGQQVPIIVRTKPNSDKYELIVGARRLYACQKLGIKLLAAIVNFTDQEALLAMDAENRPRKDLSPYERACDYQNWIEKGYYKNQKEIIDAIGIKKSLFTQLMALSILSNDIVKAFRSPFDISIKNGYKLARLYKDKIIATKMDIIAVQLKDKNLPAATVYKKLLSVSAPPCAITNNRLTLIDNEWISSKLDKQGNVQIKIKKKLDQESHDHLMKQLVQWFNKYKKV